MDLAKRDPKQNRADEVEPADLPDQHQARTGICCGQRCLKTLPAVVNCLTSP
jgi:hypothetical protein